MENLSKRSKVDAAYLKLKGYVNSGAFHSDKHLQPHELADILKISATPIRDALARLANEKMVSYIPGHGYFGKRYDTMEQEELHGLADMILIACLKKDESWKDEYKILIDLYKKDDLLSILDVYLYISSKSNNKQIIEIMENYTDRVRFIYINIFSTKSHNDDINKEFLNFIKYTKSGEKPDLISSFESHRKKIFLLIPAGVKGTFLEQNSNRFKKRY